MVQAQRFVLRGDRRIQEVKSIWWTFACAGSGWKIIPSLSKDLSSDPDPSESLFPERAQLS